MAKPEAYRSATTGRFILAPASKAKSLTVREAQVLAAKVAKDRGGPKSLVGKYATEKPSQGEGGSYRSAVSGRYVTSLYGKKNPSTTVKEGKSGKR